MRRSLGILALAVLAWIACSQQAMSAPVSKPSALKDYQQDIDGLGVIARLQGEDITARESLSGFGPSFPVGGEPGSEHARRNLLEVAMTAVRSRASLALASALIKDCESQPTPEDLTAFFPFWRSVVATERDRLRAHGGSDPSIPGEVSLAALSRVGPATRGAEEVARRSIRMWRLNSCVQTAYRSDAFVAQPKAFASVYGGALLPVQDVGSKTSLRAPAMNALSPAGSLTRLFKAAEKAGMLSFPNRTDEIAFYRAYRTSSDLESCFNDVETATDYFETPPWRGSAFPPHARPSATLRAPFAGSPAFLVEVRAGWTACRDEPSVLYLESDNEVLALTMPQAAADPVSLSNYAAAVLKGAGFPPFSHTEPAVVAGANGTAFVSSKIVAGQTVSIRVVVAPLDANHIGSETIIILGDAGAKQQAMMDQVLNSVRLTMR